MKKLLWRPSTESWSPVFHVLRRRLGDAVAPRPRSTPAHKSERVEIEDQCGRAPVVRRFGIGDIRRAEAEGEALQAVRVLGQQMAEVRHKAVRGGDGQQRAVLGSGSRACAPATLHDFAGGMLILVEHRCYWSAALERLYGIAYARLQAEGETHSDVARRVAEALGGTGMVVASGNPAFEQFWLERLMAAAWRSTPVTVLPAGRLYATAAGRIMGARVTGEAVLAVVTGAMRAERTRQRVRHRAGPDADAMLWVLQEVRRQAAADRDGPAEAG